MPCSCASVQRMSEETEPPRCVCSSARPARTLGLFHRSLELALDERDGEVDRVGEASFVHELEPVARQVVLGVGEVDDRERGDSFLGEGHRVEPGLRVLDVHAVALGEAEVAREVTRAGPQSGWPAEQLEPPAAADAVGVDGAADALELAAVSRLVDEVTWADQADLLGREGAEEDAARVWPADEAVRDAEESLDAGRVVDRARAAPHRVEVRRDDDGLVALAAKPRADVAVAAAGHEAAADADSSDRAFQPAQPQRVGAGDERGRSDRDLPRAGHEWDRGAAERARLEPGEFPSRLVLDREDVRGREELAEARLADVTDAPLDDAVGRVRVHARAGGPPLAGDLELRLVGVVAEEVELLEERLEAEVAKRVGHGFGGPLGLGRACHADADLGREGLEQGHAASVVPTEAAILPRWSGTSWRSEGAGSPRTTTRGSTTSSWA